MYSNDWARFMVGLQEKLISLSAQGKLDTYNFMTCALYHPTEGYYAKDQIWGRRGDYITAPDMTQVFGEMVALWVLKIWGANQKPSNVHIIELGPGRGTMMLDMLRVFSLDSQFNKALTHIDTVDVRKKHTLEEYDKRVQTWKTLHDVPKQPGAFCIIVSNEFFDALPIKQTLSDGNLQRIKYAEGKWGFEFSSNAVLEEAPDAYDILNDCKRLIGDRGAMLTIDYGELESGYKPSTLQAVYQHKRVSCFDYIGQADLSSHVCWDHLMQHAQGTSQLADQGDWLLNMGAEERTVQLAKKARKTQQVDLSTALARLVDKKYMGSLFKVWEWFPE